MGAIEIDKSSEVNASQIASNLQNSQKIFAYLQKLKSKFLEGEISHEVYLSLLHKKYEGKTPYEWLEFFKERSEPVKVKSKKILAKRTIVLMIALITVLFALFLSPRFIGFVSFSETSEFTEDLDLTFAETSEYIWKIKNPDQLMSLKINGKILGDGRVKVYLDDKLVLDSNFLDNSIAEIIEDKSASFGITGMVINEKEIEEENTIIEKQPEIKEEIIEEQIVEETSKKVQEESQQIEEKIQTTQASSTQISFSNVCEETCDLSSLDLNKDSYIIRVEIENSMLIIDSIVYAVEQIEEKEIISSEIIFNPAIYDAKGNLVKAKIKIFDSETKELKFEDNPKKDQLSIAASSKKLDSGLYDIEIEPENSIIKKIELKKVNLTENITELIKIDDSPEFEDFIEVYALDPSSINFTEALVTVTATGNQLLKCQAWNFSEQKCYGDWTVLQDIIPGQNYTFTMTPTDPGFGEVNITRYYLHDEADTQFSNYKQLKLISNDTGVVQVTVDLSNAGIFCWAPNWTSPNFTSLTSISGMWNFSLYGYCNSGKETHAFARIFKLNSTGRFQIANTTQGVDNYCAPTVPTIYSFSYNLTSSQNTNLSVGERIGIQVCLNIVASSNGKTGYLSYEDGTLSSVQVPIKTWMTLPVVNLSYPPANYVNSSSAYVNLTFNASVYNEALTNCSLWHNISSVWTRNQTQIVTGNSNVTTFILNNLTNTTFTWNIECKNSNNEVGWGTNRTVKLNYSEVSIDNNPQIIFNSQFPADLSSTNIFGQSMNISYNITDDISLNLSTIEIFYKTNSSLSDCYVYANGSVIKCGYQQDSYFSNSSSTFLFRLWDNNIYPANYNFPDERYLETTTHSSVILGNNEYVKIRFFNVSNKTQYGIFEIMVNNTNPSGTKSLIVYYCNSSYTSGTVSSSTFCTNFYNLPAQSPYNHSHSNYSYHHTIPFAVNSSNGRIGNVYVTSISYFLLEGTTGSAIHQWQYFYITNITRIDSIQTSSNSGGSWTNFSGTVDSHLHQFDSSDKFWYYVCANDTSNNQNCSSPRQDIINLTGLPPTAPYVYSPTQGSYTGNITINYTASISPNGYAISFYNISLVNENETYIQTIKTNNSINLSYIWDSSGISFGTYKIKVTACDIYNQCSSGYSANITLGNTAPQIIHVTSIPNTNPIEANYKTITFNASIYDAQGFADINFSSVKANFTKGSIVRSGNCLSLVNYSSNYANFSCSIDLWYFDGAGNWNITVYAKDNSGEFAQNISTWFQYNQLIAIVTSPSALSWAVSSGSFNQTSNNDPSVINNTGNANLTIQINATNLYGETDNNQIIFAGNMSASINTGASIECSGTTLNPGQYINITNSVLNPGNLSAGQGQEEIYYCIKEVGFISTQIYSTKQEGSWTIRVIVLLAALIIRRKKKRLNKKIKDDRLSKALLLVLEELKDKYSLNKKEASQFFIEEIIEKYKLSKEDLLEILEIEQENTIPVTIFSKDLGALESLVKYMKENLELSYHEIAVALNRDDRTIWTAYKKAREKRPEKLKIKETKIHIPVSIYSNKKCTILESTIIYLKEKGLKFIEIARLLDREQRNIWTIYARSKNKP